jgi:3-oxoadipate enol-lactonase
MGACIALRIAISNPSRVTALVVMASTAEPSSPEGTAAIGQVRDIWVSTPSPSEEIMDVAIQAWGGAPDVKGPRAQRVKRHWLQRHSGAENVDAVLESVDRRENLLPRLHEIMVPVMLIHGEQDETWKLENILHIRDALVSAKVKTHIVKDSGHLVIYMRDSKDVSQVIAEFVSQVLPQDC